MFKMNWRASLLSLGVIFVVPSLKAQSTHNGKNQQEYSKAVDVMASSLAILDRYFVDTINMKMVSKYGLDAMLESLDPYTEYYSKEDTEQIKLLTTGEYGGIGAVIMQRKDSVVMISEPMEGMPAALAGLKAGDMILEINGVDFRKSTSDKVSAALKGEPNSKLTLLIERIGQKKPMKFEFLRRKIVVNPVPYFGKTKDGYGYIALNSFPNTAAEEVGKAFETLKKKYNIPGLILDLRGNGGGLMDEAVKIVNFFVPEGKVVVSTKGRAGRIQNEVFRTRNKPIDTQIPIVVLVDGATASAAEIVSGALQDMDRAVVLGQKTFGKGLVQSTYSLPYEGLIKLTTAKYYIPSGRCIQRIDYRGGRSGKETKVIPDSLAKVFHTEAGRPVKDAGGILPDIIVKEDSLPTMIYYLGADNNVFDWITQYVQKHKTIDSPTAFSITDADYADFSKMLLSKNFDYDRQSGKALTSLEEIAKVEGYLTKSKETIDQLRKLFEPNLAHDLESLKPQIMKFLNQSIITRYYYRRGTIERSIMTAKDVVEAERILSDKAHYHALLSAPKVQN